MKTLCVIPARYASTRLPGKPLLDIAGKPMICRVYERAVQADRVEKVLVATDDERICEAVRAHGGEAMMTAADPITKRCLCTLPRAPITLSSLIMLSSFSS